MFHGKPIIGIVGGIGSGKSTVANMFAEFGCMVISSDQQAHRAYDRDDVKRQIVQWWGPGMIKADGSINRQAISQLIFSNPDQRRQLEQLIHPLVGQMRRQEMEKGASEAQVLAFVWDTPLLCEAGLAGQCDAVVFVEASAEQRLERLKQSRQWDGEELKLREKSQWPLDKKREMSEYVVVNTADAEFARGQVREILSRILARCVR